MTKARVQLVIVGLVVVLWAASAVWAAVDGNELLKITTPIATLAFGWLYADRAVAS